MALLDGGAAAQHFRDPMQLFFLVMGAVGRSAMLFMRVAGAGFVCLGLCASLLFSQSDLLLAHSSALTAALIAGVGGVFAFAVVPIMADSRAQLAAHALATVWLLFNIFFNYALCIATDPVRLLMSLLPLARYGPQSWRSLTPLLLLLLLGVYAGDGARAVAAECRVRQRR